MYYACTRWCTQRNKAIRLRVFEFFAEKQTFLDLD